MEFNAITQMVTTLLSPVEVREKLAKSFLDNCQCPRTIYIKGEAQ